MSSATPPASRSTSELSLSIIHTILDIEVARRALQKQLEKALAMLDTMFLYASLAKQRTENLRLALSMRDAVIDDKNGGIQILTRSLEEERKSMES